MQVLEAANNGLTDMRPLEKCDLSNLRVLHLPRNDITKIEGLWKMEQLRDLNLDHNKIKQCDPGCFYGLKSLRELHLADNAIKSLSHFGPLPRLRTLSLSNNRVSDLSEVAKLCSLKSLVQIGFQNTPLFRKQLYRVGVLRLLPNLRLIDSKEVSEDERKKLEQLIGTEDLKQQAVFVYMEQQQTNLSNTCNNNAGRSSTSFSHPYNNSAAAIPSSLSPLAALIESSSVNSASSQHTVAPSSLGFLGHHQPGLLTAGKQLGKVPVKITSLNFDSLPMSGQSRHSGFAAIGQSLATCTAIGTASDRRLQQQQQQQVVASRKSSAGYAVYTACPSAAYQHSTLLLSREQHAAAQGGYGDKGRSGQTRTAHRMQGKRLSTRGM
eukprot:GHVS01102911.1.p1 GENE.GHVS01102911.1~~GHVS01102911.1.p1  ORF type:complete len:380 (+),score=66.71 GHVS01102911.1:1142-2281(+)